MKHDIIRSIAYLLRFVFVLSFLLLRFCFNHFLVVFQAEDECRYGVVETDAL